MFKVFAFLVILLPSSLSLSENLIGGKIDTVGKFPEVVWIRSGKYVCTASIVGPRVLLTAAHCTDSTGEVIPVSHSPNYEFTFKKEQYTAQCMSAPYYSGNVGDQDFSLCKINKRIDVNYAIISMKGPRIGEKIVLMGFGCLERGGGVDGNDGKLRYGESIVTRKSSDDYYSFHAESKTVLCYGDSGAPAYKRIRGKTHYIYGVNSRSDLQSLSLLTATHHPDSIEFMRDFARTNKVKICGINTFCGIYF